MFMAFLKMSSWSAPDYIVLCHTIACDPKIYHEIFQIEKNSLRLSNINQQNNIIFVCSKYDTDYPWNATYCMW